MADKLRSVRGMNDILPPESNRWLRFEAHCRSHFAFGGFEEIRTPILESTALFSRGIGEATDIVEKEMYTFDDRKGRSLTMRPEMTASCARAYIQHTVAKQQPVSKWFYLGPMFRYERMQTGRYRQFYQAGVEVFGASAPTLDAEVIGLLYRLYNSLGIDGYMLVNSVGDNEDRQTYRTALLAFLGPKKDQLCGDCQRRLTSNPLRILDCKVESCRDITKDAPSVIDNLRQESRDFFDSVCKTLRALQIPFAIDPKIVRGLDYYTGTVFELVSSDEALGTQATLGAGGRYDNLVSELGGPETPAVGFALGIERALLVLGDSLEDQSTRVNFITLGQAAKTKALELAARLPSEMLIVDIEHRDVSFKAQMRRADKSGATWAIIIGDSELASGQVQAKNLADGHQAEVSFDGLSDFLMTNST